MNPQRLQWMVESVSRLVRRGATSNLLKIFEKAHPVEVSAVLQNLPRSERRSAFTTLFHHDIKKTSEAISEVTPEVAVKLFDLLEVDDVEKILREMTPDDAAVLIDELPEERRDELLGKMKMEEKAEVEELLEFPSETAGRIMTPNVLAMDEDLTIANAISEMQKRLEEPENSFYLYVVDDRNHLVGVSSLRQLLIRFLRTPDTRLKELMTTDVISVRADTDQEEVARLVADYNLLAIPVVDHENKLVGLVTVDDVIDVIREEATEDLFALAGVEADDRALGDAPRSFRRRVPWLLISLATGLISVFVVSQFRATIDSNVEFAILLPLVAAIGGHAATQTMTVVVRGISTGEVNSETSRRAFFKELLVGLINGPVMGTVGALAIGLFRGNSLADGVMLGAIVFVSLVVIMAVASIMGAFIPITLKRFNFDPAVASAVFVITITDVIGFCAFLGLATLALRWLA